MAGKKRIRYPSTMMISLPVEAYDALGLLAEYEGSTPAQIGRRAVLGLLAQAGMYKPPSVRAANQQQAV